MMIIVCLFYFSILTHKLTYETYSTHIKSYTLLTTRDLTSVGQTNAQELLRTHVQWRRHSLMISRPLDCTQSMWEQLQDVFQQLASREREKT